MTYRLVRILLLGWKRDRVQSRGSKAGGVVAKTYLKGLLVLPFIPWVKRTFTPERPDLHRRRALPSVALRRRLVRRRRTCWSGKACSGSAGRRCRFPSSDWLAAVGIVALVILLINRLTHPVLKLITRPAAVAGIGPSIFLPFVTGYMMTHHLWFRYEVALQPAHASAWTSCSIWIPFSRISHFLFYFFSRTIHGAQAGKRAVNA
ncbi:MAG: hypothetical protein M0C28_47820 [Candidatus Moduliflexus flocculans]|nr:hypothetical protein [Candidatus Moduliflexus flocculans]